MNAELNTLTPTGRLLADVGPATSDSDLAAWRDAATTGALPVPTRDRWQVLRAGVVNLWEFDVAEYWFADGRAQFVGQNQSGKSTLMALTTLILLAGDLDRALVDTFGQQHKSFRYYIEPTDDPTDRRDSTSTAARGWAWMEYGRLTDGVPEFFTMALYTQARRGVGDFTKTWVTCEGSARVGAELVLHANAATAEPASMAHITGFWATKAAEYRQRVATSLFGFKDTDRLDAVVRMLKVLRTPHLGQKLDPDFLTERMREALPAIAKSEIDELAEGWDQLERLAADRDAAQSARDAVTAYVRRAWNPWADMVLRRHADELVATNTRLDGVTRSVRMADEVHASAQVAAEELSGRLTATEAEHASVSLHYEQLLKSSAYLTAQAATENAANLREKARQIQGQADDAATKVTAGQGRQEQRRTASDASNELLKKATDTRAQAADRTALAATAAGFPPESEQWAAHGDVARLSAATTERRGEVRQAQQLVGRAASARTKEDQAANDAQRTSAEVHTRQTAAESAVETRGVCLQALSDHLEVWASELGADAPDAAVRRRWLAAVTDQTTRPSPRTVLGTEVRRDWLTPITGPLRTAAATASTRAADDIAAARRLEGQADEREAQQDPEPAAPTDWGRRERPAPSGQGAALWRLLDPIENLPSATLDHIEAALAASGILDAWVTPDGAYLPGRDGTDNVLTLAGIGAPEVTGDTLALVLRPAEDAGPCTDAVAAVLRSIHFTGGSALGDGPAPAISAGGWWRHAVTSGHAAPGVHGAELLGTAARAGARARQVAALRAQVAELRAQAQRATADAKELGERVAALEAAALRAPGDDDVVRAGLAVRAADRELARANAADRPAQTKYTDARAATQNANADLLTYTASHHLPHTASELAKVEDILGKMDAARNDLRVAVSELAGAEREARTHQDLLADAVTELAGLTAAADRLTREARRADEAATRAHDALGHSEQEILAEATGLETQRGELASTVAGLRSESEDQRAKVATAKERLDRAGTDREEAERVRDEALSLWWVPVDAGLGARRGLPDVAGRLITHALTQARAAREHLQPAGWPDATSAKDARVNAAWAKLSGSALLELRTVLETSGGRSAHVNDSSEAGGLASVGLLVDSSGIQYDPVEAIVRLDAQSAELAQAHDVKIQEVLVELLASTFVEHLRDRLGGVVELLAQVNAVLGAHPTGANRTSLRLVRVPAAGQKSAFDVLAALERGFVDSEVVQGQVRGFLEQQIRQAQDLGHSGPRDWKDHLADQLDYRSWFDVVTQYKVGESGWRPLTREVHAKDSGGGKVVTLLQPLLATLVAQYNESSTSPRPLWLDEAFTGVDDENRATMLAMLVTFDLDFLLAGPGTLVTAAQVPSAAVWYITRAPAPTAGVDLSLLLWAGRTLTAVPLPPAGVIARASERARHAAGPDLFDVDEADTL